MPTSRSRNRRNESADALSFINISKRKNSGRGAKKCYIVLEEGDAHDERVHELMQKADGNPEAQLKILSHFYVIDFNLNTAGDDELPELDEEILKLVAGSDVTPSPAQAEQKDEDEDDIPF